MSTSLPSAYIDKIGKPYEENWLFKIFHDTDTSNATNCIALSYKDTTVDMFYYGAVLNLPSIRESIDLASSTASSSNISLDVANFSYKNGLLSEEVLGGSRYYVNHVVKIYSQLNGESSLSNCLQIYQGRLVATTHTDDRVRFEVVSYRPWDNIIIPQDKTTANNILIPVSYGDFTENSASTFASPIIASSLTSEAYRPVPFNKVNDGKSLYVDGNTTASKGELAVHEKGLDVFVPLENAEAATVNTDNAHHAKVEPFQKRAFIHRADSSEESSNSGVTVENIAKAIDANTSTYATFTSNQSNANNIDSTTYKFKVHSVSGKSSNSFKFLQTTASEAIDDSETGIDIASASNVTVYDIIKINEEQMRVTAIASNTLTVERGFDGTTAAAHDNGSEIMINDTINIATIKYGITVTSISGDLSKVDLLVNTDGNSFSESKTSTLGTTTRYFNLTSSTAEISLTVRFTADDNSTTGSLNAVLNLYDVFVQTQRIAAEPADKLYVANDGLTESWSGSATAITEVHQAHRDLLIRYAGLATTTPTGWSDLDTARDGWDIRWWALSEVELKRVLDKMQYEGGFIFRFTPSSGANYIHIPNSPSADITLTKNDFQNIQISHTALEELMTKMVVSYKKHPAENRYFSTQTSTLASGTLPRTKWNIPAKENLTEISLDMLVDNIGTTGLTGNRNSGFAEYYNSVFGDVKTKISFRLINPSYFKTGSDKLLDVGNFIGFDNDNMPSKLFGSAWTGKVFMITSLSRRLGEINISAREV
jgi:hypothetical protein|tara:strand:- start:45 stop:2345 length:2301 start_codon:yes stop_codon:yes gene_type:complete